MTLIDFIAQDWPYIVVTLFFAIILTLNSLASKRDSDASTGIIMLAIFILLFLVPEFSAIFAAGVFGTGLTVYLAKKKSRAKEAGLRQQLLDHEIQAVDRFLFQSVDLISDAKHLKEEDRKMLFDGRRALDRLFHEKPRA